MKRTMAAVISLIAIAACDSQGPGASRAYLHADVDAAPADIAMSQAALAGDALKRGQISTAANDDFRWTEDLGSVMLIRTGHATVEVDSLEPAIAAVRTLAARLDGMVANAQVTTAAAVRSATLEIKVPSSAFVEITAGLRPLGRIESVNVSAQDVGEEFFDIEARLQNAGRLEQRLLGLLASGTGRLDEVLTVERELARVREQIERFEGRQRYLATRVSTSTFTVALNEPRPLVGQAGSLDLVVQAGREGWRNFVRLSSGFIASLGYLIPLGVLGLVLWRVLGVGWVRAFQAQRAEKSSATT